MTSDSDRKLVIGLRNEAASWTNLTPRQDEMFRQAADRIEALQSAQAWRPIESAPRDGAWVLLHGDGPGFTQCPFVGYYGEETPGDGPHWWRATDGRSTRWAYCQPTHWMPLPKPPEAK